MTPFDSGYLTVAQFKGTSFRLHWSILVGALLFSGFRFAPVFWAAFFGLVVLHELGHAVIVRLTRHRVHSIDVTGFGGLCRWSGAATDTERALIAWGGVIAQIMVLVVTYVAVALLGPPRSLAAAEVVYVFTTSNLWLIALNLLPFPPLDGAEAWPLFKHLREAFRLRRVRRRSTPRSNAARGRARSESGPSAKPGDIKQYPELAEMLKRIGDEAARARRGGGRD